MSSQKQYLEVAKQARAILAAKEPVDIQKAREQSVELRNIKTKKDALANSAFWLAVAKSVLKTFDNDFSNEKNPKSFMHIFSDPKPWL